MINPRVGFDDHRYIALGINVTFKAMLDKLTRGGKEMFLLNKEMSAHLMCGCQCVITCNYLPDLMELVGRFQNFV